MAREYIIKENSTILNPGGEPETIRRHYVPLYPRPSTQQYVLSNLLRPNPHFYQELDEYSQALLSSQCFEITPLELKLRYETQPEYINDRTLFVSSIARIGVESSQFIKTLVRQIHKYHHDGQPLLNPFQRILEHRNIKQTIKTGTQELPYLPALTTRAIFEYDLDEEQVDPSSFTCHHCCYLPPNISTKTIKEYYSNSPSKETVSTGSALVILRSPNQPPQILLRKRPLGSIGQGTYSIPGGKSGYDFTDPTGLRETIEETGIHPYLLMSAQPLGICDQLLCHPNSFVTRYVNTVWSVTVDPNDLLIKEFPILDNDDYGMWKRISLDQLSSQELSPIAHFAITIARQTKILP